MSDAVSTQTALITGWWSRFVADIWFQLSPSWVKLARKSAINPQPPTLRGLCLLLLSHCFDRHAQMWTCLHLRACRKSPPSNGVALAVAVEAGRHIRRGSFGVTQTPMKEFGVEMKEAAAWLSLV